MAQSRAGAENSIRPYPVETLWDIRQQRPSIAATEAMPMLHMTQPKPGIIR